MSFVTGSEKLGAEVVVSILEATHPMPPAASAQLKATIKRVLGPVATACLGLLQVSIETVHLA
jgi:hypothetical protein